MEEGDDIWLNKTYTLQLIDDAYFVGFDTSSSKLISQQAPGSLQRELQVFPSAIFAPGGSQIKLADDDNYLMATCNGASDSVSTVGCALPPSPHPPPLSKHTCSLEPLTAPQHDSSLSAHPPRYSFASRWARLGRRAWGATSRS